MSTYIVPFNDLSKQHGRIDAELRAAVGRVLDANWFIGGSEVESFEREFAAYCGVKGCVGVSNGLDALHLILRALELPAGGEVILPANTFIATALAVSYAGLTPVLVDPDEETGLMSAEGVEAAVTDKTIALIPVHLYGSACDMDGMLAVAKRHGLYVVEDNAQAQGCIYKGRMTGAIGTAAGVSFYPGKNLGALGDAGAVLTNDEALARKIKALGNYGSAEKYDHAYMGFNSRLDSVQAAALRAKLTHLNEWNGMRKATAADYYEGMRTPLVALPVIPYDSVWHIFPVRVKNGRRDAFRAYLEAKGIETLIHYPIAIPAQKAYAGMFRPEDYPSAMLRASELVSLPMFPYMSEEQVARVIDAVNAFRG